MDAVRCRASPRTNDFRGAQLGYSRRPYGRVIAVLAAKGNIGRRGIIAWNLVCLVLLLNIDMTAILSTPSPWRVFMNEPANYVVTHFPIALLPASLVPLAYYPHFMSFRQMSQEKAKAL